MAEDDKLLDPIRRADGSLPDFPDFERPCRICGKANDHIHHRWDERLGRNVVIKEPTS